MTVSNDHIHPARMPIIGSGVPVKAFLAIDASEYIKKGSETTISGFSPNAVLVFPWAS